MMWLLHEIYRSGERGISRTELERRWRHRAFNNDGSGFSKPTFFNYRDKMEEIFGLEIRPTKGGRYCIANPEQIRGRSMLSALCDAFVRQDFLMNSNLMSDQIEPEEILEGGQYLMDIGLALKSHRKLSIVYQKYHSSEPHTCILHPYGLKADHGRWYLCAYREGNEHRALAQTFALDRIRQLQVLTEEFDAREVILPGSYFRDSYGIWVDHEHYPVEDIRLLVSARIAGYFRTLPLHHSQREEPAEPDGRIPFVLHLSPTPDFVGELLRWGSDVEVVSPSSLRQVLGQHIERMGRLYGGEE